MTSMDFDRSTQATSWIFDTSSLAACKEKAVSVDDVEDAQRKSTRPKARKFASGFHRSVGDNSPKPPNTLPPSLISTEDQEALVQFHAHQIQTLIGPSAILVELRTNMTALATAVTFFRRFYLSNSVLSFNPRKVAAACAFFAAKVEDQKIEVGLLSHATAVVQMRVQNAPLCRTELRSVSVPEILDYERILMEGLNYQFRCHHPFSAMQALALDYYDFLCDQDDAVPVADFLVPEDILDRACAILQRAMIFSDVTFLFAPGHIGFASVAIALGCTVGEEGGIGQDLLLYLENRFCQKSEEELARFVNSVNRVIRTLCACPLMDLMIYSSGSQFTSELAAQRAEQTKRILAKFANLRHHLLRCSTSWSSSGYTRKRSRVELEFTPPRQMLPRKSARVTPTGRS